MNAIKKILLAGLCASSVVACTNLVGTNSVDSDGNPVGDKLVWPNLDDATQPEGTFPTQDEIEMIQKNLSHLQLKRIYYLMTKDVVKTITGNLLIA